MSENPKAEALGHSNQFRHLSLDRQGPKLLELDAGEDCPALPLVTQPRDVPDAGEAVQVVVPVYHLLICPVGNQPGDTAVRSADETHVEIGVTERSEPKCQLTAQDLVCAQIVNVEKPVAGVERDLHRRAPVSPSGRDGPRRKVTRCLPLVGDDLGQLQLGPEAGKGLGEAASSVVAP